MSGEVPVLTGDPTVPREVRRTEGGVPERTRRRWAGEAAEQMPRDLRVEAFTLKELGPATYHVGRFLDQAFERLSERERNERGLLGPLTPEQVQKGLGVGEKQAKQWLAYRDTQAAGFGMLADQATVQDPSTADKVLGFLTPVAEIAETAIDRGLMPIVEQINRWGLNPSQLWSSDPLYTAQYWKSVPPGELTLAGQVGQLGEALGLGSAEEIIEDYRARKEAFYQRGVAARVAGGVGQVLGEVASIGAVPWLPSSAIMRGTAQVVAPMMYGSGRLLQKVPITGRTMEMMEHGLKRAISPGYAEKVGKLLQRGIPMGAGFGVLSGLRDFYQINPESGEVELREGWDRVTHGLMEAGLWQFYEAAMMAGGAMTQRLLESGGVSFEQLSRWAASKGLHPQRGEAPKSYLRRAAEFHAAEGMPLGKPPPSVARQITAQAVGAGVEALGFSALDTEFLAKGARVVLEGDWDAAAEMVEQYLSTWPALLILKAGSINAIPDYQRREPPEEIRRTVQETLQLGPKGGAEADLAPVERLYVAGYRGSRVGDRILWRMEGDPSRSFEVTRSRYPREEAEPTEPTEPGAEALGVKVNRKLAKSVGVKSGEHHGRDALDALERIWLASVESHIRARADLPGHELTTDGVRYLRPSARAGPPWAVARRFEDTFARKDATEPVWEKIEPLALRPPDPDVPQGSRELAEQVRAARPWVVEAAGERMAEAMDAVAGLLETRSPERDPAVSDVVELLRQRGPEPPVSVLASALEQAAAIDAARPPERPEDGATYKALRAVLEVASGISSLDRAMQGIMPELGLLPREGSEGGTQQAGEAQPSQEPQVGRELPGEGQLRAVEGQEAAQPDRPGGEVGAAGERQGQAPELGRAQEQQGGAVRAEGGPQAPEVERDPNLPGEHGAELPHRQEGQEAPEVAARRAVLERDRKAGESGQVAVDILTVPITGPLSALKTGFEYWSRGLVDRIGDLGGPVATEVHQRARKTIDRAAQLKGQLDQDLSAFQRLTSRHVGLKEGREGVGATRRLNEVRWEGASGFTLYHEAMEGRGRTLDATERKIVDAANRMRLRLGELAEKAGVQTTNDKGERVPFVTPKRPHYLRAFTQEMHDLTLGSQLFMTLAAEVARLNKMPAEVAEGFLRKQIEQGWVRQDYSEVRREIPVLPDLVKLPNGQVVRIMEADPYHHMTRAVELGTRRIAFIEQFGQDVRSPDAVERVEHPSTKDVLTEMVKQHGHLGLTLGRDLFRALHGLPTTPPGFLKPGTGAHLAYRLLRFVDSLWRSSKLTLAAVPNAFEFLGAPTAYVGTRRAARAYSRIAQSLFRPVDGRRIKERVEWAESLGAIEIKPSVFSMREGQRLEDTARAVAQVFLAPVKGAQFVNELLTVEGAFLLARDLKSGKGTKRDAARLRLLGFSPEQVADFMAGKGTPEMAGDLLRRIVGVTMGGASQAAAERSRFALNRWLSDHVAFQNYFQARANQWNTLIREVQKDPAGLPSVAVELLGLSTLSGALAIASKALVLGGLVALLDELHEAGEEIGEDPITGVATVAMRAAASNMVGGMGGTVWDAIFTQDDALRVIARSVSTWQSLATISQMISGSGRYLDRGITEDPLGAAAQLARELPAARALERGFFGLSIIALGESDPTLDRALSGLRRWRRENADTGFGSAGESQDQHIEAFRKAMRLAKERLEKGKGQDDVDFQAHLQEALAERFQAEDLEGMPRGKRRKEAVNRVAASLRAARIFAGQAWTGLTREQKAELERHLGPERWERLRDYDRLIERLSKSAVVNRKFPTKAR